jgi:hypothetical protein
LLNNDIDYKKYEKNNVEKNKKIQEVIIGMIENENFIFN